MFDSDLIVPYQIILDYVGGDLSRKNLFALNEFDQIGLTILRTIILWELKNSIRDSTIKL